MYFISSAAPIIGVTTGVIFTTWVLLIRKRQKRH
jgi:hypothetical protein